MTGIYVMLLECQVGHLLLYESHNSKRTFKGKPVENQIIVAFRQYVDQSVLVDVTVGGALEEPKAAELSHCILEIG